ncbi:MAG: MerR family transcriptional regulator [Gemmatimonadetes bacterium]|nr:MerR family transcriptional regulator [Gemmatimonadota bacterium]
MTTTLDRYSPILGIGAVARELGVAVGTVRLYENRGLVLAHRTATRQRFFSMHDLERLRCVRKMITEHGLNIKGIKQIMALIPCWEYRGGLDDDCRGCPVYSEMIGPCWSVRRVGAKCRNADCRQCDVYRMRVSCDHMKDVIHGPRRRGMLKAVDTPERSI